MIGGACSLVVTRSRGCRPNITSREVAPELFEEMRTLLASLDRDAAVRLAQIIRREAMDERNVVAIAKAEEVDVADQLAALCARRRS